MFVIHAHTYAYVHAKILCVFIFIGIVGEAGNSFLCFGGGGYLLPSGIMDKIKSAHGFFIWVL